ncbi:MAG: hypothetical protein IJ635_00530 [Bacteroidaceae bacterium]|nr:hypothetical protein [Bacteroidaceae bacterium]
MIAATRQGRVHRCMVFEMEFCYSLYKKTTRTFEHRGEAWRVLALQRYNLFPNRQNISRGKSGKGSFSLLFLSFGRNVETGDEDDGGKRLLNDVNQALAYIPAVFSLLFVSVCQPLIIVCRISL